MKKSGAIQGQSASELITKRIADLGDWRGETLATAQIARVLGLGIAKAIILPTHATDTRKWT